MSLEAYKDLSLEGYKDYYKKHSHDALVSEIKLQNEHYEMRRQRSHDEHVSEIKLLRQENKELLDNVKVKDWEIRALSDQIASLQNRILSLTDSLDVVTTPRMLACQNPYMIEEHTKKKNNASEST